MRARLSAVIAVATIGALVGACAALAAPKRPPASLPGMWERTLTLSSAGKSYSFTGWKVGWATGPAPLVVATRTTKQFLTFVSSGPFQHAVAVGALGHAVGGILEGRDRVGGRARVLRHLEHRVVVLAVAGGTFTDSGTTSCH